MHEVDKRDKDKLSYDGFVKEYMKVNEPCIITGLVKDWTAYKELNNNGIVDIDYLEAMFGDADASVHVTTVRNGNYFGGITRPSTKNMTIMDYCQWWRDRQKEDGGGGEDGTRTYLYLKDWKFTSRYPDFKLYTLPTYFRSDWLNDVASAYKFVYLGVSGTCTRMHADVLRSYSWSSNVVGRKRWYLVRPEHTPLLYDVFGRSLCPHLHFDVDNALHESLYPGLSLARKLCFEVIQDTGETIFVPSGWCHTVENLEDTLSVNHNWLNGFNIKGSWGKLKEELRKAIERKAEEGMMEGVEEVWSMETRGEESEEGFDADNQQASGDLVLLYDIIAKQVDSNLSSLSEEDLRNVREVLREICEEFVEGGEYGEDVKRRTEWRGGDILRVLDERIRDDLGDEEG